MNDRIYIIDEARKWFIERLGNRSPVKLTIEQYEYGVIAFPNDLLNLSVEASREICTKRGRPPLTNNEASIALISAMNKLKLIEVL